MTVAIAHKDYDVRGGGEIVAETLANGLDAPLYVGHGNPEHEPEDKDLTVTEIGAESHLHKLAAHGGLPRAIAHMLLWRDHANEKLKEYDVVITSGNETRWWTPTEDEQTVVAYVHSTPWFQTHRYDEIDGLLGRTLQQVMRHIYESQIETPDLWVANSDVVKRRMVRYWNVDPNRVRVVYPPVNTDKMSGTVADTGEYYLYLGRVVDTKRIGPIIDVANQMGIELRIAGTGDAKAALEERAGSTVTFEGWVEGDRKRELLSGAKAVINNSITEDFGIVPIEAMASGTPVLSVTEGMPQYTINPPKCGLTYQRGNLQEAIQRFEQRGVEWAEKRMAEWAHDRFNEKRFITEIAQAVTEAEAQATVTPQL